MTRKNFTPAIKAYLLETLTTEDHDLENPSEQELITYCKDRFNSEYGYLVQRVGQQKAIREWLLGLALNVEYTYYNIEQLLLTWGVLVENEYSDIKLEKALDLYWDQLARNLVKLFATVK